MTRKWVVDSSPLIVLGKIGFIYLLEDLSDSLIIPVSVKQEILRSKVPNDPAVEWLSAPGKNTTILSARIAPALVSLKLGEGETEALSFAVQHPEFVVILDDGPAREATQALGLRYRGTLGVILLAKKAGLIPWVRPLFEQLYRVGFRMDWKMAEELF